MKLKMANSKGMIVKTNPIFVSFFMNKNTTPITQRITNNASSYTALSMTPLSKIGMEMKKAKIAVHRICMILYTLKNIISSLSYLNTNVFMHRKDSSYSILNKYSNLYK